MIFVVGLIYLLYKKLFPGDDFENLSANSNFDKSVDSSNENKINGKSFFISKCAPCHNPFRDGVGPALSGLSDRGPWNDLNKLYNYIRDPESLGKDKYIDSLRKVYGVKHMAFPDLSNEEIKAILRYINVDY